MKKVLFFASLCFLSLSTWHIHAENYVKTPIYYDVLDIPDGFERIELHGSLNYGTNPNAIEAYVSDEEVYIRFNQNFGYVSISLYDSNNNLVYHSSVDTSVQPIVIIPLNDAPSGEYYLELNHITGGAEGGFDHNNN